jgi:hypothetical protein
MPTPKKPNFADDDEQTQTTKPHHDDDTDETPRVEFDHRPGLNDEDDEATVAVPPVAPKPATPRTNRR